MGLLSRDQIAHLIAAVQRRVLPSDRLPTPPGDGRVVPDWARPPVPDWISHDFTIVMIGPDDEITIETEDIGGEGASAYDLGAPHPFDDQVPPLDALAYYIPFHFFQARWGIYLLETGVLELTRHIVGGNFVAPIGRWVVGFAARALFLHEFFHHAAEVACSRLELPLPTTWLGTSHYTTYFTNFLPLPTRRRLQTRM